MGSNITHRISGILLLLVLRTICVSIDTSANYKNMNVNPRGPIMMTTLSEYTYGKEYDEDNPDQMLLSVT